MPHKATAALAAVLFFGGASVVWADDNSQINGSFAQQPVAIVSNGRTAVNQAAKAFPSEEEPLLAPSQRDGTTVRTTAWIRLTEPGGKPIHINVEHVTSVRSDTQIPGAKAQLDLTSGKFQGVQEDVERVMPQAPAKMTKHQARPYDQAERARFKGGKSRFALGSAAKRTPIR